MRTVEAQECTLMEAGITGIYTGRRYGSLLEVNRGAKWEKKNGEWPILLILPH